MRRKLDSLVRLRELRPLGPKGEESYRALCDREQELLRAVNRQPVPDWLARHEQAMHDHQAVSGHQVGHDEQAMNGERALDDEQATAPAWSEPPDVNEWPSFFAPPGGQGYDGDGQCGTMPEPSAVYWPFP